MSAGQAVADAIAAAPGELALVFAAVAVLFGALLLWRFIKQSARDRAWQSAQHTAHMRSRDKDWDKPIY
jgi:hypothetical protein